MAKGGGSIESLSLNGRGFAIAADSDPGRILGGSKNSIEMNGDGTFRTIAEQTPSKIAGISVQIDDDANDHEFIQDLINGAEQIDISITYYSGTTYYGQGQITEDSEYSPKSGTMELTLEGGRLRQQ